METVTRVFRPNRTARFQMRLGVIGHAAHWVGANGEPLAYEPYVREMRIWADLFSEINICSPIDDGPIQSNVASYHRANIRWHPVSYTLAAGQWHRRLLDLPWMIAAIHRTIKQNDFIHLRSPGHFGLVGAVLTRLMGRASITKWAGENDTYEGERWPSRLDRRLQSIPSRRNFVLVYGPAKFEHQISFIPALMSDEELEQARSLSRDKTWRPPWQILSVGRLVAVKGFELALLGLAELKRRRPDIQWRFTLIGDGPCRDELAVLAEKNGMKDRVTFTGSLAFKEVQEYLAAAHLVIMPGVKEGWGKVITEAWAHGAIPVAADGGNVRYVIRDEGAGVIFDPCPEALAKVLATLLVQPERMQAAAADIYRYAADLSVEQFQRRLERVLVEQCGLK